MKIDFKANGLKELPKNFEFKIIANRKGFTKIAEINELKECS